MECAVQRSPSRIVVWTLCLIVGVYVAWVGAWLLKGLLDRYSPWLAAQAGGFVYWTAMKLLVWIPPALLFIRLSGRSVRDVIGFAHIRSAILWGGLSGLALGSMSLAVKAVMHRPLLSVSLSWPFFSVIVIAPVFEEFLFRGAVLGTLVQRYRFALANVLTAALFVGLHLPGWYFQGRLWLNLTSPISGALSIFLLGLVFGLATHKSKSLMAGILAHGLNNFFS
jgi:membrane protease YdiL (CAAX protease family)